MKRTLTLWLAVLALAIAPLPAVTVAAQQPAAQPNGKIHGTVTNPVGTPQPNGTVSLSSGPGEDKYTFQVTNGAYSGEAAPGTYTAVFRNPDTPKDKQVDSFQNVKIVSGQDTLQDFDMTREAYIKQLPPETQKQLEELKKKNAAALSANTVIKQINGDLATVTQDIKDADAASTTAQTDLGASASKTDVAAKANDIRTTKYTDVETLMNKDTTAKPDASILWARLGQAEAGLKKWDPAIAAYQKAIDIESKNPKPNPEVQGLAQSGLGEVYARTGKVDDATKAYDAAATANPKSASVYYKNQAVIYFQTGNAPAQAAAADKAITADPSNALLYYLKGQALVGNATVDPKTQKIVLPPGCAEAYQKYLELAPNGPYAADAKGILDSAGQKVNNSYKAGKKS